MHDLIINYYNIGTYYSYMYNIQPMAYILYMPLAGYTITIFNLYNFAH